MGMMKAGRILTLLGMVALAGPAFSQRPPRQDDQQQIPSAGFWPTSLMMERFIDRLTEDLAATYDLDEDQLYNTRELWKERFPAWLNDHRGEIMQLTNEYFEALLAGEPPAPAEVAGWAGRALPLFDEFTDLVEGVTEEMGTYFTDDQRVMLDSHMAGFRTGLGFVVQRLGVWSEGGYDPETEWPGSPGHGAAERQREREMQEAIQRAEAEARGEAPAETDEQPSQPAASTTAAVASQDEWTKYVEDFIIRYQLTAEQQAKAYKVLRSQQEQRERYLRRQGDRLAAARQALQAAKTDEERSAASAAVDQFQRPLDRMFTQLVERLDRLPTRKQRLAAAEAGRVAAPPDTQTKAPAAQSSENEASASENP